MLSKNEQKLIKSLSTKKGRKKHGLCLVEGEKVIETAGNAIEKVFTAKEEGTSVFRKLVTTETPQETAAIARIPKFTIDDIQKFENVIVLDGVQDPGNIGTILRLCLGFNAGLILIESADPTSPKVIRSSVGAMFQVPWIKMSSQEAEAFIKASGRYVYRLEKREGSESMSAMNHGPKVIIVGSEGSGIHLPIEGSSIHIDHSDKLESLNVAVALGIVVHALNSHIVT